MAEWVSVREVARRRGVTPPAVLKAVWTGRIPSSAVRRGPSGRLVAIELEEAMRCWDRRTDPAEAAKSGTIIQAPQLPLAASAVMLLPAPGEGQGIEAVQASDVATAPGTSGPAGSGAGEKNLDDYHAERAKSEKFRAAQAELAYLEAVGKLVSADDVRQASYRRYRSLRDQLLNIPDRIASVVAAEREPARVHAAIAAEIKRVLNEFSEAATADAAPGAAERVGD